MFEIFVISFRIGIVLSNYNFIDFQQYQIAKVKCML